MAGLDKDGNLVGMIIDHAKKQTNATGFILQQFVEKVA
jgi:hypothetical protein